MADNTTEAVPIDDNIPVPPVALGAKPKYPFAELEVGQSFHVALSPKRLAGTVSSANKKFRRFDPPRRFVSRTAGPDDPRGEGTRVWRVE